MLHLYMHMVSVSFMQAETDTKKFFLISEILSCMPEVKQFVTLAISVVMNVLTQPLFCLLPLQ
jgi:hypothetical protein